MSQGAKTTENTAVNRLIELAQTKPLEVDEDLFLDATARAAREAAKRAVATAPQQPAPPKVGKAPSTGKTLPPPFRQTGPVTAVVAPLPRPSGGFPAATPPPELVKEPSTAPFDMADAVEVSMDTPAPAPLPQPPRLSALPEESNWYQATDAVAKYDDEYLNGTSGVRKQSNNTVWYVVGAFGLGLALAAVFFWPRGGSSPKPAPAPVAGLAPATDQPAPAPTITAAPTVTPMPTAAPAPTVEVAPIPEVVPVPEPVAVPEPAPVAAPEPPSNVVTFESTPAGATVVLVDNGQMTQLGAAPIDYELEPGKHYEVMFTLEGHTSLIVPVEGGAAERVAAAMGTTSSTATIVKAAAAAPAVAEAPAEEEVVEEAPAPAITKPAPKKVVKTEKKVAKAEPKPKKVAAASTGGSGILKIGAKPPCDVLVDGKKVGTSPIANLKIAAGKHKVTLVNREYSIKETVSVTVKAGETVKLVKDLTKKMK